MTPETKVIEITDKQEPVVRKLIESGRFRSANDVFNAGLGFIEEQEKKRQKLVSLLDQADSEEAVEIDLDVFSKEIEAGKHR